MKVEFSTTRRPKTLRLDQVATGDVFRFQSDERTDFDLFMAVMKARGGFGVVNLSSGAFSGTLGNADDAVVLVDARMVIDGDRT